MTTEAIARPPGRLWHAWVIEGDLRALLDAHAEALDALEASPDTGRHTADGTESPCACSRCRFVDLSCAVLAKAGRR